MKEFHDSDLDFSKNPNALRLETKKRRLQISAEERARSFQSMLSVVFSLPEYKNAKTIAAYYGKISAGEFDTLPLLQKIIEDHKSLALPRVDIKTNRLILYQINNLDNDLESGVFGLVEPKINPDHLISIDQIDLIIVPGLVFDQFGNRYGYGKGYYDSLLSFSKSAHFVKMALVLDDLVQNFELVHTSKDIPMDLIITEKRVFHLYKALIK